MLSKFKRQQRRQPFHFSQVLPLSERLSPSQIPQFTPSCDKVQEWWDAPDKIKMLVGGNQSGKTTTAAAYVADFVRNHPGCLVWAVAPTFDMTRICFDTLMLYFHPTEIGEPIWAAKGKGIAYSIEHMYGGRVEFKSADAGFRKFEGAQVDLIWPDEQIKDKMVFSSCLARTTMTKGQIILSFTPLLGKQHWSYTDLFQKESVFTRTITLYDNIYLDPESRDAMIDIYSEDEYPYRVMGEWGILEGRVYKAFNADVHVIPRTQQLLDTIQTVIRGIDFGRNKACSWVGIDHNERAYVISEWKGQEYTIEEMADEIKAIEDEIGPSLSHKVQDTQTDHSFQERFDLEKYSIYCTPANKSIDLGLTIIQRRLKVNKTDNQPAFFICDTCPETISEYENYIFADDYSMKPKKPQNDHLCDASRYALVELDEYCSYQYGLEPSELVISAATSELHDFKTTL